MSRTDVYKQALAKAAKAPADAAKRIAADPIATIENAPKGNHEIHQSRGESIKALGKKQGSDAYEGNQLIVKADELLYERHHLIATGGLPFSELRQRSRIN